MSALSATQYKLIVESEDAFGRPNEIRGQCDFLASLPYIGSVCCLNFGALLLTVAQAFKARHLSLEFAESAQISRALITITMVIFVGGPVLVLARDNANAFVFVASAIIFLWCSSILLLLFIPKIKVLQESRKPRQNRTRLHISGVDMSGSTARSRVGLQSENSVSECEVGASSEFTGMKVLTTKTPEELVREVDELKRLLKKARAPKENDFAESIRDSGVAPVSRPFRKKSILKISSDDGSVVSLNKDGRWEQPKDDNPVPPQSDGP